MDDHASPDTAPWRAVWAAYADQGADPARTWDLIAAAAAPIYADGLADPAVRHVLATLLDAPLDISDPFGHAVFDRLTELKGSAVRDLVASGATTFYLGFAEIALHRAVLRGALGTGPAERARLFLAEITAAAAEYLVGRDQVRLMAPGHGISYMSARKTAIVEAARARASSVALGSSPLEAWPDAVRAVWRTR